SAHYPENGARARDFWGQYPQIAWWLAPWAQGPGYLVEELFCPETAVAWSHGERSSFIDNPGHCHAALRSGAVLPWPPKRKREDDPLGAYSGESIRIGERKSFRILP